ncbi:patatin-like phospholipase family protein [Thalassiella azotivora]
MTPSSPGRPATGPPPAGAPRTAFVLGGGGVLGSAEVGMLRALVEAGVVPDLVVGTSVGAVNGAVVAADPGWAAVQQLTEVWTSSASGVWSTSPVERVRTFARTRTAFHSNEPLRRVLAEHLGEPRIEDLAVPFQCCAASIERAEEHWFDSGPLLPAVLASCAVPGLFPAVAVDGEHYLDGGLVNSVPVGRAVASGATEVFVLQVGRIERQLTAPRRPWEVALVAFEVARRHRFTRDMSAVPEGVRVHVLPSGDEPAPIANLRYRDTGSARARIARAHAASARYLESAGVPS